MEELPGSVTRLFKQLQAGDQAAEQPFWDRYFDQLTRLCQMRLASLPTRAIGGEDVSSSVLATFIRRSREGQFGALAGRDDLWRLLFSIAMRKSANVCKAEQTLKRGAGKVAGENRYAGPNADEGWHLDMASGNEPEPELVVALTDVLDHLREKLPEKQLREFALFKLEGLTNAEISERMNCSHASVERRLQLLRQVLSEMNFAG